MAVRIGPNGTWNGISDSDPMALFSFVADHLNQFSLASLSLMIPRLGQRPGPCKPGCRGVGVGAATFKGRLIAAGSFEPAAAGAAIAAGTLNAVAFGRHFVANPDLPERTLHNLPLAPYDRSVFYTFDAPGWIDYPAYAEAPVV